MANKYHSYKETHRIIKGAKQKRCTRCKRWKEESEFHKDPARKDGFRIYCKGCVGAYDRKRIRKNRKSVRDYLRYEERHRIVRTIKEKLCSRCKEWKYESEFHKERRLKDGLSFWCKGCSYKPINKSHKPKRKSVSKNLRYEERHRIVSGGKQKFCLKCKKWRSEREFYKNRSAKDGLTGQCRECSCKPASKPHERKRKGVRRNLRYEERHRTVNGARKKLCTKCGRWKTEGDFHKENSRKDGLTYQCKKCSHKAYATSKSRKK